MDNIVVNASYFGWSALTSFGTGWAARDCLDGNYLFGIAIGALTSLPLYLASKSLKKCKIF